MIGESIWVLLIWHASILVGTAEFQSEQECRQAIRLIQIDLPGYKAICVEKLPTG